MTIPTRNPFLSAPAPVQRVGRPRLSFSRLEGIHLAVGVVLLSAAFAFLLEKDSPTPYTPSGASIVAALVAVATGFVLHEMAHKVVAQHYGHWAEFRAQIGGLLVTVLLAAFTPFLIAVPGAVMIQGRVTPRENGLISIVGPATNLVVAAAASVPLLPAFGLDIDAPGPRILHVVAFVNALLGVFNLIPLGNLDGRKVLRWSRLGYSGTLLAAVGLFVAVSMNFGFP